MGELGADRPMTEVELRQKVIALEAEVKVLRATVVGLINEFRTMQRDLRQKQVNRYLDHGTKDHSPWEAEVKVLRATVVGLTKQVNRYLDEKEFHDACQAYRHTPSLG